MDLTRSTSEILVHTSIASNSLLPTNNSPSQFGFMEKKIADNLLRPSSSRPPIHPSSFIGASSEVSIDGGSSSRSPLLNPTDAAELVIHQYQGKQGSTTEGLGSKWEMENTKALSKDFSSFGRIFARSKSFYDSPTNTKIPAPSDTDIRIPISDHTHPNQQHPSPQLVTPSSTGNIHRSRYVPLYLAALEGDWESADDIFKNDIQAVGASITEFGETPLHIASGAKRTKFVQNIVQKMDAKQLRMKNFVGNTALCFAAASGVTDIAKAMVNRDEQLQAMVDRNKQLKGVVDIDEELFVVRGSQGTLPLYMAALLGHKEMVSYLYDKTKEKLNDDDCDGLLVASISSDLYDFAAEVLRKHPKIAIPKDWRKDETEPESDAAQSQDVNNDAKQKHEENQTPFQSYGDQPQSLKNIDTKPNGWENQTGLRFDISQPHNVKNKDGEHKYGDNKIVFQIDIGQPQNVKNKDVKPKEGQNKTAFHVLARKQQAYGSGNQLSFFKSLSYNYLCVDALDNNVTPENNGKVSVKVKFCQDIIYRVPYLNHIHDQKMMHTKVLQLLQTISHETLSPDNPMIDKAIFDLCPLLFKAAELGIVEFLVVLIRSYPDFFWKVNEEGYTIFHIAVIHRQEKVFSLIHEFGALKDHIVVLKDKDGNNMLHLAAIPPPQSRLKVDSGAALQLRKELLWFTEVEKIMQPSYKDMENKDWKTPKSLFTEKHKKLVKDGEEWVKGTSTSCMLVSTLIATVTFAALFTVPGGNNDVLGVPIFRGDIAFAVFAISDSASLICSAASILTFLSILTSRCAEQDFVRTLPHRLFIGLITLLFSIASMMVAFGATLLIVVGHGLRWFTIPVFVACVICVIWFTWLHLSLLKDIASDEYNSTKLFQTPMNLFEKRKKPVE